METDLLHTGKSLLQGSEDPRTMLPGRHFLRETRRRRYCPGLPWLKLTARLGTKLPRPFVPL